MDMNHLRKRLFLLLAALLLLCLLSGCRTRTSAPGASGPLSAESPASGVFPEPETPAGEEEEGASAEPDGTGERTRENPESSRREYDGNAPVEIVPGTERLLHTTGEGEGAPLSDEESPDRVSRLDAAADQPALQTVPAESAEEKGVSEDAEEAESAMTYFTVLLEDRTDSLFECKRLNVYWETPVDRVTIHKTSPEHTLILQAGCYDVSVRLQPESLAVDDGWVVRKNPGVIVKVVDSSVLGSGVSSTAAAAEACRLLRAREGWSAVEAVREGRILLLSRELLAAPYLRTAAALMLAKEANPSLYADVRPEEALRMLAEEAAGTVPDGIFYYSYAED